MKSSGSGLALVSRSPVEWSGDGRESSVRMVWVWSWGKSTESGLGMVRAVQ